MLPTEMHAQRAGRVCTDATRQLSRRASGGAGWLTSWRSSLKGQKPLLLPLFFTNSWAACSATASRSRWVTSASVSVSVQEQ